MKFEKGKEYECIRWLGIVFESGKVYPCEEDGLITDINGARWGSIEECFKLHEPKPKRGDRVMVWDEDEATAIEFVFVTTQKGPYVQFKLLWQLMKVALWLTDHSLLLNSNTRSQPLNRLKCLCRKR